MFLDHSSKTFEAGKTLAKFLKVGDIIVLEGDLGVGKTLFSQGIVKGLGFQDNITSPTFALMNEYQIFETKIYHIDAYRIKFQEEVYDLGLEDIYLEDAIILIEWADNLGTYKPKDYLKITLEYKCDGRELKMEDVGRSSILKRGNLSCLF